MSVTAIGDEGNASEPAPSAQMRDRPDLDRTLRRMRARAFVLRAQSYLGLLLVATISISLIYFLSSRSFADLKIEESVKRVVPQTTSFTPIFERHNLLVDKLDSLIQSAEQQTLYTIDSTRRIDGNIAKRARTSTNDLRELKQEITDRVSKDLQQAQSELRKITDERDSAIRNKVETGILLRLIGEAAFRVGAILISIYFISILANVCKYLMRVADHLNAAADSLEVLSEFNMPLHQGLAALTPHPIDFHVDDVLTMKDMGSLLNIVSKEGKK